MSHTVIIEPVKQGEDIVGAVVVVGEKRCEVAFTLDSDTLRQQVTEATGVELDTQQIMTITRLSREQMENESTKVLALLKGKPAGTVAVCGMDMHAWINPAFPDELTISQQLNVDDVSGEHIGIPISEVGALDTDELNDIAEQLRVWLKAPAYHQVDAARLAEVS